jgi:hypothetical protein
MYTMKNTAMLNKAYTAKETSEISALDILARVYSQLLGEEITQRKLHHLLHVQISGFMLFLLAAWNVLALTLGIIWFATALYGAKEEWNNKK